MAAEIIPAVRTNEIKYAIRDIAVLASEVAKSGKEMLYLNIGDPNLFDFSTPKHLIDKTYEAMLANKCGYAPSSGIPAAVKAIEGEAQRKGIENILDIFVTTGASEAIELCLTALLNEGDNILTPTPGYSLYTAVQSKLQAYENPYYMDESNGWQPDVEDIKSKINEKTRGIILINPNNPTGSVSDEKTLREIVALAKQHNLIIFADEIYDKLIIDEDKKFVSIASLDKDVPCITFGGLSKNYLAPGFRIGWGIISGRKEQLANYIEAVNKMLRARLSANHPEQYAIAPALEGDHTHLKVAMGKLKSRRDLTIKMLNEIPGISCVRPDGAFYAFAKIELKNSDDHFVKELLRETGVVIVPGSGFGQRPGTSHFRVVFLPQEEVLAKAYEKIAEFYTKYKNTYEK